MMAIVQNGMILLAGDKLEVLVLDCRGGEYMIRFLVADEAEVRICGADAAQVREICHQLCAAVANADIQAIQAGDADLAESVCKGVRQHAELLRRAEEEQEKRNRAVVAEWLREVKREAQIGECRLLAARLTTGSAIDAVLSRIRELEAEEETNESDSA